MLNEDKNIRGITLIALVITIIVLLILAGISVAMLTGQNGILTQAQNSKQVTEEASEQEKRKLSQAEANTHLESYEYTDAEGNTAKIPAGFAVSNVEGENLVSKGLVIIGSNGNEYVWIPCTTDITSSDLQYKRTEWRVEVDGSDNSKASKDEETLDNSTYSATDISNGINENIGKAIVSQIKDEKASVEKYGGYYIGRYEVGKENNQAVIRANLEPYTDLKWSQTYELSNKINVGENATSYLCSSYAWDTAINFIQNNGATNCAISTEKINMNWKHKEIKDKHGTIIKPSGMAERLKTGLTESLSNIYDIGGNVAEFTTEINPDTSETLIVRGGSYSNSSAAGERYDVNAGISGPTLGFRATLFLK